MIKKLIPHSHSIFRVVVSTLIATSLSLIDIVDSYYVDLISVVLLLEITRLVLFFPLEEKENNTILFAYFGLLFGLLLLLKYECCFISITIYDYILKNRNILKCINLKNILITLFSYFYHLFYTLYILTYRLVILYFHFITQFLNLNILEIEIG